MKAIRAWGGNDTYGRAVEVAEREDGLFFYRFFEYNGYGKAWTKWELYDEPHFETEGVNRYTGERIVYTSPVLFWGWNPLVEYQKVPRFRL